MDYIAKIVLGLIFLIILIMIVGVVFKGEFSEQLEKLKDILL